MKRTGHIPQWTIHMIVWLILIALQAMLLAIHVQEAPFLLCSNVLCLVCALLLFYLNYLLLVGKFWIKRRYAMFVLLNLAALALCTVIREASNSALFDRKY